MAAHDDETRGLFGPHVHRKYVGATTLSEHLLEAIKQAREYGVCVRACQVFISSPRSRKLLEKDPKLAPLLLEHGITGFAHGTYSDVPWSDKVAKKAASFIRKEMAAASECGLVGLIIHLPGVLSAERTAQGIEEVFSVAFRSDATLYLETPAVKPNRSTWHDPAAIANLLSMLSAETRARVGICIDTAHLHACGVQLRDYEDAKKWLDEFSAAVGPLIGDRIFIHFNDSKSALGSGIDVHESIGEGLIWKDMDIHASGAKAVIEFATENNIPAVFERNNIDPYPADYIALQSAQIS